MGSDFLLGIGLGRVIEISIHAPMWGATLTALLCEATIPISIHAPMWGATCRQLPSCLALGYFNPRSHVGSDPLSRKCARVRSEFQSTLPCGERRPRSDSTRSLLFISIHAPMWGATSFISPPIRKQYNFNPRSHVGSDPGQMTLRQ